MRPQVAVDVTGLFWKYRTGVQNYYYGLIEGLADLNLDDAGMRVVFIDRSVQGVHSLPQVNGHKLQLRNVNALGWLPTFDAANLDGFWANGLELWNKSVRGLRRQIINFSKQVDRLLEDVDVLQVWNWDIKTIPHRKHVITLYDVIPILFADLSVPGFVRNTRLSLDFARENADRVIAVSEFTKSELMRVAHIPESKITVVYLGVRTIFHPLEDRQAVAHVISRYSIGEHPYILSVGYLDPRKNVQAHVQAFERLVADKKFRDFRLVLVGPESPATSQVLKMIQSSEVRDRVCITGYIPDNDVVALMNGASVFVYCSLYEGFGFPVLEAMACGTPVVTSNTTSLPEISGDAAILVDPKQSEQIAEAIKHVLMDNPLRGELMGRGIARAKQFTWRKCAQEHIQVYRNCYLAE